MTDNQLVQLIAGLIDAGVTSGGWQAFIPPAIQKDQPTQQGTPTGSAVFLEKLFDDPYGWPMASRAYNLTTGNYDEIETQLYRTTFQISGLVKQDPTQVNLPTASDVVNYVKSYVASRQIAMQLQASSGVGIERVTNVRNPPFQDDSDQFEFHPNFDIVVSYTRTIVFSVPAADKVVPSETGIVPI